MRHALVAGVALAALPFCPALKAWDANEQAFIGAGRTWAFTHVVPDELRVRVQPASVVAANAAAAEPSPAEAAGPPALPAAVVAAAAALEGALPPPPPPVTLVLSVDLAAQRVTVAEGGNVKHVWLISSGRGGYATKTGTFRAQWMTRLWHSRQWDWAPMPHAVFFNRGTAFHATTAVGMLGRPASHGCIRLAPGNAAQLYALVQKHGPAATKVVVHAGSKEPAIARRSPGAPKAQLAAGRPQAKAYAASEANASPGQRKRVSRYTQPTGLGLWPF